MTIRHVTGHCLCGALRYRFDPANATTDYCHCKMCQRWSGAPVTAWAGVPAAQFEILAGEAKAYPSSAQGIRYFCPHCGSVVYMTDAAGTAVGVMLGTVDDPSHLAPRRHGWTADQVAWLRIEDDLPRWPEDPSDPMLK